MVLNIDTSSATFKVTQPEIIIHVFFLDHLFYALFSFKARTFLLKTILFLRERFCFYEKEIKFIKKKSFFLLKIGNKIEYEKSIFHKNISSARF